MVSLDCDHVSKNVEEFYTVRCQVSEMRNLQQSLEEITVKVRDLKTVAAVTSCLTVAKLQAVVTAAVKALSLVVSLQDMLEGDNKYTCSQCERKVRAEKRACFKKLPQILAFNTMRYSFNMITMLREKVNTFFSFPMTLDMSPYLEENLIQKAQKDEKERGKKSSPAKESKDANLYRLIGVTVHTGTADGGHYYGFIRDLTVKGTDTPTASTHPSNNRWYSFNDAEIKPFDPNQIGPECFGGEFFDRTYDQVRQKFIS